MRRAGIVLAAAVGFVGAYLLAHLALIEIGREVIVLHTTTGAGESRHTRLWVIDYDGFAWINGGGRGGWYGRLVDDPNVEMTRSGRTMRYRAVPVPEFRGKMHALLREKYGFADWWVRLLKDPSATVPIRLEPVPPEA